MEILEHDISEILIQLYGFHDNITEDIISCLNIDEIETIRQKVLSVGNESLDHCLVSCGVRLRNEYVYTFKKNLPVSELIKQFNEKGKRSEAARQLKDRFLHLEYEDQKKVFDLFLKESESYRKWCYNTLLRWRDRSFDDKLIETWNRYHDNGCAWAMICLFEAEKLKYVAQDIQLHIEDGCFARSYYDDKSCRYYYMLCWKMAGQNDFIIDWDYVRENCDADYYLKLANRAGIVDSEETCRRLFYHQVLTLLEGIVSDKYFLEKMHKRHFGLYTPDKEYVKTAHVYTHDSFLLSNVSSIKTSLCEIYKMGHHSFVLSFYQWELQNSNEFVCTLEKTDKNVSEEKENQLFAKHTIKRIPSNFEDLDHLDIQYYKGLRDSIYYVKQVDKPSITIEEDKTPSKDNIFDNPIMKRLAEELQLEIEKDENDDFSHNLDNDAFGSILWSDDSSDSSPF